MNRKLIRLMGIGDELTEKAKAKVKFHELEGEEYQLEDEDFQKVEQELMIFADEIVSFIRTEDETVILTRTELSFSVKETLDEIEHKLKNNN